MKSTTFAILIAWGLAVPQWAPAQTSAAATNSNPPDEPAAGASAFEASNAPAAAVLPTGARTNGAQTGLSTAAGETNAMAAPGAAGEAGTAAAGGNEGAATAATDTNAPTIPLIQFQDTPITAAIQALARQANINYLLDPKIGYNQPGPNGQIKPEPTLSIRWENVTARQALLALLDNYGLQLVQTPDTKIARITIKNPNAPPPLVTKVLQLKYASVSNMVSVIETMFTDKRSKVIADTRTSQLVVVATESEQTAIGDMVAELDTPTKQVLIAAMLFETTINPTTAKGVDWFNTLSAQHLSFGNGTVSGISSWTRQSPGGSTTTPLPGGRSITSTSGASTSQNTSTTTTLGGGGWSISTASGMLPNIGFLNADGLNATLSFFNQNNQAKILSEPRTVTMDNQTAHISVGQEYPIINVTAGTANTTGGSQISYSNLTVSLDVTPRISANNYINLRVTPHIMRLDSVQKFTVGASANGSPNTFDVPIFDTRDMDTTVMIPSGDTLVMGGLLEDDTTAGSTKVPILGDLPGFGALFRSNSKTRTKDNLLVFITPTIISTNDFQPTKTAFLKTAQPADTEPDWSTWDSTKPYQWGRGGQNHTNAFYGNRKPSPSPALAAAPGAANANVPPPSAPPASTANAVRQYESTGVLPPAANAPATPTGVATNATPNP